MDYNNPLFETCILLHPLEPTLLKTKKGIVDGTIHPQFLMYVSKDLMKTVLKQLQTCPHPSNGTGAFRRDSNLDQLFNSSQSIKS